MEKSGTELVAPETDGPVVVSSACLEQASALSFSAMQESFNTVDFVVSVEALSCWATLLPPCSMCNLSGCWP
uniref:Uncharacterized protein n=1 Tax=Arundo donax TaxID=35708 RepID=A0A0A9G9Y5_ARUDO